jgi:hypothetical protein
MHANIFRVTEGLGRDMAADHWPFNQSVTHTSDAALFLIVALAGLPAGSPTARPRDMVSVMHQFVDLYLHHLLTVGFLAYVRGAERVMTVALPDLPCRLIFEFLGEVLPPNENDYLSTTAQTTRADIVLMGAGILGSLNVRQYMGERQKNMSAKAHLAPHLSRNKTLLTEIRVYAIAPRWQLFALSKLPEWITTFRDIKTYDIRELLPKLLTGDILDREQNCIYSNN